MVQPDQAFAALVGCVLVADAAERERSGNRLERLDADRDANHWSGGAAESGGVVELGASAARSSPEGLAQERAARTRGWLAAQSPPRPCVALR